MQLLEQVVQDSTAPTLAADGPSVPADEVRDQPAREKEKEPKKPQDPDLAGVCDHDKLSTLLTSSNSSQPFGTEIYGSPSKDKTELYMPKTLSETLVLAGESGNWWNSLFRFSVQLRCMPGGADTAFLRNPMQARRLSKTLNWHQSHGFRWYVDVCGDIYIQYVYGFFQAFFRYL